MFLPDDGRFRWSPSLEGRAAGLMPRVRFTGHILRTQSAIGGALLIGVAMR